MTAPMPSWQRDVVRSAAERWRERLAARRGRVRPEGWRSTPAGYGERLQLPGFGGRFVTYRHTAYVADAFAEAMCRPDSRTMLNEPPQTGKSTLTTLLGVIWLLDNWPGLRVALVCYGDEYAWSWGARIRDTIADNAAILRVRVEGGHHAAAKDWQTTAGGGLLAVGVGGSLTGRSADVLLVDDPHKNWAEALSAKTRRSVWDGLHANAFTRAQPGTPIWVTMTRWHEDDVAGRLRNPHHTSDADRWRHLVLPALATAHDDPLGRTTGEPLDPRQRDAASWASVQAEQGSHLWAGLYQQAPSPPQGTIFRRDRLQRWTTRRRLADFARIVTSWDMAFKDPADAEDPSYVVGQVWGAVDADRWLLDQFRAQVDFPATLAAVRSLAARWPQATAHLVEDRANGPAVISTLRREIPGIIAIEPEGSKLARAHAVSPQVEAGNVWVPADSAADWAGEYVEELALFDRGAHDDQVDATTQALRWLQRGAEVVHYTDSRGRRR